MSGEECHPEWYVWLNDPSSDSERRVLIAFDEDPDAGGRVSYMHAGSTEGC